MPARLNRKEQHRHLPKGANRSFQVPGPQAWQLLPPCPARTGAILFASTCTGTAESVRRETTDSARWRRGDHSAIITRSERSFRDTTHDVSGSQVQQTVTHVQVPSHAQSTSTRPIARRAIVAQGIESTIGRTSRTLFHPGGPPLAPSNALPTHNSAMVRSTAPTRTPNASENEPPPISPFV